MAGSRPVASQRAFCAWKRQPQDRSFSPGPEIVFPRCWTVTSFHSLSQKLLVFFVDFAGIATRLAPSSRPAVYVSSLLVTCRFCFRLATESACLYSSGEATEKLSRTQASLFVVSWKYISFGFLITPLKMDFNLGILDDVSFPVFQSSPNRCPAMSRSSRIGIMAR